MRTRWRGWNIERAFRDARTRRGWWFRRAKNTGTVDLGACTCTALGAWAAPQLFAGFLGSANATTTQTQGGVTFSASSINNTLTGTGINVQFGSVGSGRRAWALNPDGRYFAYVASPNGPDWSLTIVALQTITRSNGPIVAKGVADGFDPTRVNGDFTIGQRKRKTPARG